MVCDLGGRKRSVGDSTGPHYTRGARRGWQWIEAHCQGAFVFHRLNFFICWDRAQVLSESESAGGDPANLQVGTFSVHDLGECAASLWHFDDIMI